MTKNQNASKRERKQHVLQDHKRVGSRFIPPILARLPLAELSYVRDLLPEIVWIGLVIKRLGYREGIDLCATAAKAAKKILPDEKFMNFGLCSSWGHLSAAEREALLETLTTDQLYIPLQKSVEPLLTLYVACPMSFISLPTNPMSKERLVTILRECVDELIDKYCTPAMAAQAALLYIRGLTGGLYFLKGVETPDLDAIITRPESEIGQRSAAMVRASVLQELMPLETERVSPWAQTFWNEALYIDSCQFKTQNDGD